MSRKIAWFSLILLAACGRTEVPPGITDGGGGPADMSGGTGHLVSISVTPPIDTIATGTTVSLTATGVFDDNSTADLTATATWTSSNDGIAGVAGGVVSGNSAGTVTITASVGDVSGTAQITVSLTKIVSIQITPPFAAIAVGAQVQFTAVATLSDGSHQDVTNSAKWDAGQIAMASNGLVTGVSPGSGAVSATLGGVTGFAKLQVTGATLLSITLTPVDPTVGVMVAIQFTATGNYSDGSIADLTKKATWASSAPNTVNVAPGGLAVTVAEGTAIVSATVGNVTGQTTVTVSPAKLLQIQITPAQSQLAVKGSEQLLATGIYSDGSKANLTATAVWSSSDAMVAAVSNANNSKGQVTGVGAGTATITATVGGISGTATVTVIVAKLVGITIAPQNPSTPKGSQLQFKATGTYNDGSTIDVTSQVTWSTDAPGVATISNANGTNGLATAVAPGKTTVSATLDGVTGTTVLTVTAAQLLSITIAPADSTLVAGLKQFMTATAHYSDGTTVDVTTQAVWSTADQKVAIVSNANGAQGLLSAVGPGKTTVSATFMNVTGTTSITVTTPTLLQVVVTPINLSLPAGQNQQYQAVAIFSNGTSQNVTLQVKWSSSAVGVATINGFGTAHTVAAGMTTISAVYQNVTGSTTLTVTGAVVTGVEVTPINPTYPAGTIQQFQAVALYSDNTSQNVTGQATWMSSAPNVAGVTNNGFNKGRVTTLAPGQAKISATFMGLTGSSTVTVTNATLVSLSVFPATATLAAGEVRQFTCQGIYSDNTSKDVTALATWTSSAPAVVGVSDGFGSKGLATAIAPGMATISCNYMGLHGDAAVTVTKATVSSIQVTPAQPSVPKGTPLAFQAVALFSDNTSQNVTAQATWTSSDNNVAVVSNANGSKGVAQTLAAGTTTIAATWMGVTGSTLLTVTPATLTAIQVTPPSPTLPVGFATQLTATGLYSDNTTQDLTQLATWVSSAPNIAAVSDQFGTKGRLSPLAAGTATISATYMGVTGTDKVTVSNAVLLSIAVTPAMATIGVGGQQAFTATGSFSDGSMMNITTFVTWLSSNPAVADVFNAQGSQGVAQGFAKGTVTITAVRGNVSGKATLTVQ